MEKFVTARQSIEDSTIRHMGVACWITKAIDTYSECVIIITLRRKNSYVNVRLCYVIRILPIWFIYNLLAMLLVAVTTSNVRITNHTYLIEKYAVNEEHDIGLRKLMKILNQDIRF